jgi:hypothetical protein
VNVTEEVKTALTPGVLAFGNPETIVLFLAAAIAVALLCRLLLCNALTWLSIPTTVPLMAIGMVFGYFASQEGYETLHTYYRACNMTSRSMMYLLLPGLTFDVCFKVRLHLFRQCAFEASH